jgi:hypothetical protein
MANQSGAAICFCGHGKFRGGEGSGFQLFCPNATRTHLGEGQYQYGGKYLKFLPTFIGYQPGYISIEPQDVNFSKTYPLPHTLLKYCAHTHPHLIATFTPICSFVCVLALLNLLRQFQLTYTLLEPHDDKSHIQDPNFILTF